MGSAFAPVTPLDEARRKAEEALESRDRCSDPECSVCVSALAVATRSLLAALPEKAGETVITTSDFHASCDWCKRDIPNACYAVLCSDCDRRGNTALFAAPEPPRPLPDGVREAAERLREVRAAHINGNEGAPSLGLAVDAFLRYLSLSPAPAPEVKP